MNWYKYSTILSILNLKPGDAVYVIDDTNSINEYGIVYGVIGDDVYGWWGDSPEYVINNIGDVSKIEKRPLKQVAVGRLPDVFLRFLVDNVADRLPELLSQYKFLEPQLDGVNVETLERSAQSMYQLDIPIPSLLDGANSERIWLYDMNASNLWWGEGDSKWEGGKEDVIQGLPRYNPEYHDDGIGAFFTWWEPYTEPVPYEQLINLQRAVGAYFYPGKYY